MTFGDDVWHERLSHVICWGGALALVGVTYATHNRFGTSALDNDNGACTFVTPPADHKVETVGANVLVLGTLLVVLLFNIWAFIGVHLALERSLSLVDRLLVEQHEEPLAPESAAREELSHAAREDGGGTRRWHAGHAGRLPQGRLRQVGQGHRRSRRQGEQLMMQPQPAAPGAAEAATCSSVADVCCVRWRLPVIPGAWGTVQPVPGRRMQWAALNSRPSDEPDACVLTWHIQYGRLWFQQQAHPNALAALLTSPLVPSVAR